MRMIGLLFRGQKFYRGYYNRVIRTANQNKGKYRDKSMRTRSKNCLKRGKTHQGAFSFSSDWLRT